MMSILIEQLINITDAIFLWHIGEIELGASALAGIWYLAIYMLGLGFSQGLQVVIARRNGEKHYSETGKTFFQGLFFLSGLAVFLCLFFKLFSPMILSQLITSPKVYHAVIDYLDWRIWGLLFSFPFLALRSFLVGITQTRALTIAALSAVLVNILGNWMLIFLLDMGIAGAAIASSVAELCSLAILSIHIQNMNKQPYGLYWQFDKNILFRVCRISAWSMFHSFISVAPWFLFFVAIEHLGELQLAVANIIRSISTLFFVIVNSFSSTASSLISNMIGAKERKCVFPLCNQIIRLGYAIGFPFITLALIFNQSIISVYTNDPIVIRTAWLPFTVMLLNYVFALPGYVYINAVIGTGATRTAFIFQSTTIITYILYLYGLSLWNVPFATYWTVEYLFVIGLGIQAVIYLKYKHY